MTVRGYLELEQWNQKSDKEAIRPSALELSKLSHFVHSLFTLLLWSPGVPFVPISFTWVPNPELWSQAGDFGDPLGLAGKIGE